MYKLLTKVLLSMLLLSEDFLIVYTQSMPGGATTENVIVNINKFIKPEEISSSLNNNKSEKNSAGEYARTARDLSSNTMREIFACALALDASCLVDRAEDIVDIANTNLLRQADLEAKKLTFGRSTDEDDEESTPSTLISSIAKMVLELPELLRESIGGILRSGKLDITGIATENEVADNDDEEEEEGNNDDDDDDEEDEEENNDDEDDGEEEVQDNKSVDFEDTRDTSIQGKEGTQIQERKKCGKKGAGCMQSSGNSESDGDYDLFGGNGTTSGREVGGGRKKKKKKKALIKLLLIGLVLKAKIALLLKLLVAKLQVKFLLIAAGNLLINFLRLWWDLKKGHNEQPPKVIYHEHAQHQHHYDGGEDWHTGGGASYYGRSFTEDNEKTAQDMAYSKQIPQGTTDSRINGKSNISWSPRE